MKIDKISVTYGRKVNLGNYSSLNVEISIWADIEDSDNPRDAMDSLWETARAQVAEQVAPFEQQLTAKTTELLNGLPVEARTKMNGVR